MVVSLKDDKITYRFGRDIRTLVLYLFLSCFIFYNKYAARSLLFNIVWVTRRSQESVRPRTLPRESALTTADKTSTYVFLQDGHLPVLVVVPR
ncbi:hypothetical protein EV421DRAFT_2027607 [Armillaria borealis]|uniref:Uncharacterized protein n=1 Tax=Armillaria borealis TaxID=47425 RepID=A0AA39M4Q0_9AGAR|nr:hypothetical protein EV421DRAFT_2027607 [Armillaria borealis]